MRILSRFPAFAVELTTWAIAADERPAYDPLETPNAASALLYRIWAVRK